MVEEGLPVGLGIQVFIKINGFVLHAFGWGSAQNICAATILEPLELPTLFS